MLCVTLSALRWLGSASPDTLRRPTMVEVTCGRRAARACGMPTRRPLAGPLARPPAVGWMRSTLGQHRRQRLGPGAAPPCSAAGRAGAGHRQGSSSGCSTEQTHLARNTLGISTANCRVPHVRTGMPARSGRRQPRGSARRTG